MRSYDLIGGIFFLAMGLIFTLYAGSVDIGAWDEPGPGFLPFYAGMLLIGMSVALVIKAVISKSVAAESFFPEPDSWKRVLSVVLALVGFNLLLQPLGFILVTFLFVGFLVKFIFPQSWLKAALTAAFSTLGAWLVFVRLLEIQFPKGIAGF